MRQSGRSGVCAREHVERLLIFAVVGKRPAVSAEHRLVLRVPDRSLLQDGCGLRLLAVLAECLRIGNREVGIVRVLAELLADLLGAGMSVGRSARDTRRDRAGCLGAVVGTACHREGDGGQEADG